MKLLEIIVVENLIKEYKVCINKGIVNENKLIDKIKNSLKKGFTSAAIITALVNLNFSESQAQQLIDTATQEITLQQSDTDKDTPYIWTPKVEQKKRFERAKKLYEPLVKRFNKLSNFNDLNSVGMFNINRIQNLYLGTLYSSPNDDEFPEFHSRNPPPLNSTLEDIQQTIINLPDDKLVELLNLDFFRKPNPKLVYDVVKITGTSTKDIVNYVKVIKVFKDKDYTF